MRHLIAIFTALLFTGTLICVAHAGPVLTPDSSDSSLTTAAFQTFQGGAWLAFFGTVLLIVVRTLRKGFWFIPALGDRYSWFKTRWGGYVLAFGVSLLSAVGVSWAAGDPLNLRVLIGAVATAYLASGMYEHAKDVS